VTARLGAAIFWVVAGTMHFVKLVVASGLAEIAGGVAILPYATRRGARWWLLATPVAVYPANIHMAVNAKDFPKIPAAALWARLPVQGLFALLTWRGTR
jgi:uncharacterized membrane protein